MLPARARSGFSLAQSAAGGGGPCLSVAAHIDCHFRKSVRTAQRTPTHAPFTQILQLLIIFPYGFYHSIYRCISVPVPLSHSRTTCMTLPPPKPKAQILESSSMHVPRQQHPLRDTSAAVHWGSTPQSSESTQHQHV